jgi:hypothetical protein
MAQATNINAGPRTFTAPPAMALVAVLALSFVILAALFLTNFSVATTVQPRSEAVLEAGRTWQRQYEQISGLEARRRAHDAAVVQSGLDWEQRYKDMYGQ